MKNKHAVALGRKAKGIKKSPRPLSCNCGKCKTCLNREYKRASRSRKEGK